MGGPPLRSEILDICCVGFRVSGLEIEASAGPGAGGAGIVRRIVRPALLSARSEDS